MQAPAYSQSFNRYSYVWNNPLKYTDPDGYQVYDPNYGMVNHKGYNMFYWQISGYEHAIRTNNTVFSPAAFQMIANRPPDHLSFARRMGNAQAGALQNKLLDWFDKYPHGTRIEQDERGALWIQYGLGVVPNYSGFEGRPLDGTGIGLIGLDDFLRRGGGVSSGGGSLSNTVNWSEVVTASAGLVLGVAEIAVGLGGKVFTAGVSTALTIDGGIRVGSNAAKLYFLLSGNSQVGVATPSNAGGWIGKSIDMAKGTRYKKISYGQGIGSFTNDFSTFVVSGGSAAAMSHSVMYPSVWNVAGYGATITLTPYTTISDLINWYIFK